MTRADLLAAWSALPSPKPPYDEAAELIGCTRSALATGLSRARRDGVEFEGSSYRGRGANLALLEDWTILAEGGASPEEGARRLGVHVRTIRKYDDLRRSA